jgi:hypothetical protein
MKRRSGEAIAAQHRNGGPMKHRLQPKGGASNPRYEEEQMTTKDEVAQNYQLDAKGIVLSPGKFEGEPWYVVALWNLALEGCADREVHDGTQLISCFEIDAEIVAMCGNGHRLGQYICVWERDNGFVDHAVMRAEYLDNCDDDNETKQS